MVNLGKVTDLDFGLEIKYNNCPAKRRYGARGIVIGENSKIAVFFKQNKNEYKLPGGGIEKDEDPSIAFKRECEEELGYRVEIERLLGTIIEEKSQENFEQLSYVFVANVAKNLGTPSLTQKEKDEGAIVVWMSPTEALEKMKYSLKNLVASKYDSVYRTQFMVQRDIVILQKYISEI